MKKRKGVVIALGLLLIICFLFRDRLTQTYVTVFHERLEVYSKSLLDNTDVTNTIYGLWDVDVYHDDSMVEFMTGGFGLAPGSTYKGFYYSGSNMHKPFSAVNASNVTMEIEGDYASWTDGTDNNGTSTRIIDNWFWFEASF